ncbi:MAG TPA: DUF3189 family protein [Firmicutes bacterium]|nr:DUF3189 family protein [Bacillota bacterium]
MLSIDYEVNWVDIIYCCYGGAHSSPIAAAIHIGQLNSEQIPTASEIWNVQLYDRVESSDRGKVNFIGEDECGNRVYVCGRGSEKQGIEQAIKSGILLAGGSTDGLVFIDTLPAVNILMRIGGFMSRKLKWVRLGRPLVIKGTQLAFFDLVRIVTAAKKEYGIDCAEAKSKPEKRKTH